MDADVISSEDIFKVFEELESNLSGKDIGLPAYYEEQDIPIILEVYKRRVIPAFKINSIKCNQRWKSVESLQDKLYRHLNNGLKTFYTCNDWFGACLIVQDYNDIESDKLSEAFPIQFTHQLNNGYNAIHAYLYKSYRVPIEIQFHTMFDHVFNVWNRRYNYKKIDLYGQELRMLYEAGELSSEDEYLKALTKLMEGGV